MASSSSSSSSLQMRDWTFSVSCQTRPGETVCVTGSVAALGGWRPADVLALQPRDAEDDDE